MGSQEWKGDGRLGSEMKGGRFQYLVKCQCLFTNILSVV